MISKNEQWLLFCSCDIGDPTFLVFQQIFLSLCPLELACQSIYCPSLCLSVGAISSRAFLINHMGDFFILGVCYYPHENQCDFEVDPTYFQRILQFFDSENWILRVNFVWALFLKYMVDYFRTWHALLSPWEPVHLQCWKWSNIFSWTFSCFFTLKM